MTFCNLEVLPAFSLLLLASNPQPQPPGSQETQPVWSHSNCPGMQGDIFIQGLQTKTQLTAGWELRLGCDLPWGKTGSGGHRSSRVCPQLLIWGLLFCFCLLWLAFVR